MVLHPVLKQYLRRRRTIALCVYAAFALAQIPLVLSLVSNFTPKGQFTFGVLELALLSILFSLDKRHHFAAAFAHIREGRIVKIKIKTETESRKIAGLTNTKAVMTGKGDPVAIPIVQTETGILHIDCNGKKRKHRLRELSQVDFFRVGDRVLFSSAFASPLLLSHRDKNDTRYACPLCGTMIPAMVEENCFNCGLPAIIQEK